MDVERKKCNRCKNNLRIELFAKKRDETYQKHCIECNRKNREQKTRNKCEHGRQKSKCKDCGGSSICSHGREKSKCKDCGGASVCSHERIRSMCKDCGGSQICIHERQKSKCKDCGGSSICSHGREKSTCKECDPDGHLSSLIRSRLRQALKNDKELHTFEYLGAGLDVIKPHLEKTFKEGMTWENIGEWHIDHIVPLKYFENGIKPTHEQVIERLHYTNLQALWRAENITKGNRFIG